MSETFTPEPGPSLYHKPASEDALTDFDGWVAKLPQEQTAGIRHYLNDVPEPDRQAAKLKLASVFAISEETGLDPFTVRDNWLTIRKGYSEQQGAEWDGAQMDDTQFHAQLLKRSQNGKQQRDMVLGLDTDDEAGRVSREDALANYMLRGAVLGEDPAESFVRWEGKAATRPEYKVHDLDRYYSAGKALHADATARLEAVLPLAREAFTALSTDKDLEATSEALFPKVAALKDDQRRTFLAAVRIMAEAAPDQTKATFWGNMGKAFSRGGGDMKRGVADYLSAYGSAIKLELGFYAPDSVFDKQLEGVATKLGEHNLEADLRRVQQDVYSPVKEVFGNGFERAIYGTSSSVPYTLSAMLPGGALAAFASMSSTAYDGVRFRSLDAGLSDSEASINAATLAPIVATPQAALEKLGAMSLLGKVPYLNRALLRVGDKLGGGAAGVVVKYTGKGIAETATERAQDLMQPLVEDAARALDKDIPAVVWKNGKDGVLDNWWAKTAETFLAVLPFTLLGGIDGGQHRVQALTQASDLELRAFGAQAQDITAFREAVQKGPASAEYAAEQLIGRVDGNSEAAKAATAELASVVRSKTADAEKENAETMRESGVKQVVRNKDGWSLVHEDGRRTQVSTAGAAVSLVQDLSLAKTKREAASMMKIVNSWHDNAPAGVERETALTGDFVQALGGGVTRNGENVTGEFSASALDQLAKESQMDAQASGNEAVAPYIEGKNEVEFRERVGETAAKIVQRLEINRSSAPAITAIHEQLEASFQTGVLAGVFNINETQQAVAAIAPALDPARARDAEERAFRERVQRVASGNGNDVETRETFIELAIADQIGQRKDGNLFPAGSVTAAVRAQLERAESASEVKGLKKLTAALRAIRRFLRGVFGTVAAIKKAKRDGTIGEDWTVFMEKFLKLDGRDVEDAGIAAEVEAIANEAQLEYTPPDEAQLAAGVAFSLRARDKMTLPEVAATIGRPGDSRAWAELPLPEEQRAEIANLTGKDLSEFRRVVDASALRHIDRKHGTGTKDEAPITQEDIEALPAIATAPGVTALTVGRPDISRILSVRYHDGWFYYVEEVRTGAKALALVSLRKSKGLAEADTAATGAATNPYTPEALLSEAQRRLERALEDFKSKREGYSLAAGNRVELIARSVEDALAKAPEKRLAVAKRINDKLQELAFRWQNERQTPNGDAIRPLVEQRDARTREMEERWYQAARREELEAEVYGKHAEVFANEGRGSVWSGPVMSALSKPGTRLKGRLMSISKAMRSEWFEDSSGDYDGADGVPRFVFGGELAPDQAAQELFDEGLIPEPTPDALWSAIKREIAQAEQWKKFEKAAKEELTKAKEQARQDAKEWRQDLEEKHKKDWSPRARLIRDLQAYNAFLSVLPVEVRGQMGGFVRMVQVGDKRRIEEIGEQIQKASKLLEKYLRAEYRERIADLFDSARPEMKAGKKPRGNMTPEGHRLAALAEMAAQIPASEVGDRIDAIGKQMMKDGADLPSLAEQMQIIQLFGGLDKADAVQLDAAAAWLEDVVSTGKSKWRILEEARLEGQKKKAAALRADTGKKGDVPELQANLKKEKSIVREVGGWANGLSSIEQVIEKMFGRDSKTAQNIVDRYRLATHRRTDAIIAKRKEWDEEVRRIFGAKDLKTLMNDLADHSQVEGGKSMTVNWMAGRSAVIESVPVEIARRAVNGSEEMQRALGFDSLDVAKLEVLLQENDALDSRLRKQNLELERFTPGTPTPTPLSQMQGVYLTMLAQQEQYTDNLTRHGWTPEVLGEIESKLTTEAKQIREWLSEQYRNGYASINEVFQRMFGAPLPQIENYSRAHFESQNGGGSDLTPDGAGLMGAGGLTPGELRTRTNHKAKPQLVDALASFWAHTAKMEHFKAFAEISREARAVMLRPEVRASVVERAGQDGLNALTGWISTMENDGVQQSLALLRMEGLSQRLQNAVSITALAWNLGTAAKNMMSVINATYEMPAGEYLRGVGRFLSGQLDFRSIYESPMIQRRLEAGASPEQRQVMQGFRANPPGKRTFWLRRFAQWGMDLHGLSDALGNSVSAAIYYDWAKREAISAGMDEAQAARAAMRRTEAMVDRTAQPVETMNKSLIEAKMAAAPNSRWIFLFASESRQKAALYMSALSHVIQGKAEAKDWRVLAISHVVAPLFLQTISNIVSDTWDDDNREWFDDRNWSIKDYAKAMLLGPAMGIPLLGKAINGVASYFFGTKVFKSDPTNPIDGLLQRVGAGLEDIIDKNEAEPVEKGVKLASAALNLLTLVGAAHPAGDVLQFLGPAGNVMKQVFQIGDNFAPETESEKKRLDRLEALRRRKDAREARRE